MGRRKDWPKDGTWQLYFHLSGATSVCQDYAKARHARWVENEIVQFYHTQGFLAFWVFVTFVAILIGWGDIDLHRQFDLPPNFWVLSLVAVWVGLLVPEFRIWKRSWANIVAKNVIPKAAGDFIVAAQPQLAYLPSPEHKYLLSWPSFCVGCCAPSPSKHSSVRSPYGGESWQVPFCEGCFRKISRSENPFIAYWKGKFRFNVREYSFEFKNHSYGVKFHDANRVSNYVCSECKAIVADTAEVCAACGFKQPSRHV